MVRLDLDRIRLARTTIDPVFLDTPQYECAALGDVLGCSITLKIETLNPVRSFKGRGTETALSWLAQREEAPTAVCASAGNLGQALAYSGARRGIPVTVVAARTANPFKIERIAALGARVRLEGDDIEDARLLARKSLKTRVPIWSRTAWTSALAREPGRSASNCWKVYRSSTLL